MRVITLSILLLAVYTTFAQPGNGRGGGGGKRHASPEVEAKIQHLKEIAGGGNGPGSSGPGSSGPGSSGPGSSGPGTSGPGNSGPGNNNGNAYGVDKSQEVAELTKIDAEVKELEVLEDEELNQGQEKKNLRGKSKPVMPSLKQHDPGHDEAMKKYVLEMKQWEKENPGSS
jgi:hypothetical protein|eukprot:CAMPEP_0202494268 /NCGR_PEP_ID=MMETSP1361-20130828/11073_1 /ASSEMBLY_ACC=CAM_ASM_000849 /TAXON_ID=210615 /ORGANISM="Staurosira complex sp., Strain CCMP2646" /LENGTH=170 /DNA_ID=CAMNT_0049124699 /DNA_START=33 /DNA_END=545 /DNA_ORIENTATION=+